MCEQVKSALETEKKKEGWRLRAWQTGVEEKTWYDLFLHNICKKLKCSHTFSSCCDFVFSFRDPREGFLSKRLCPWYTITGQNESWACGYIFTFLRFLISLYSAPPLVCTPFTIFPVYNWPFNFFYWPSSHKSSQSESRKVFDVLLKDISIKSVITSWLLDCTVFGLSAACHPCLYSCGTFLHTYLEYAGSIWGSPCVEQIVFSCAHKPLPCRGWETTLGHIKKTYLPQILNMSQHLL